MTCSSPSILLVDDEPGWLLSFETVLESEGVEDVVTESDPRRALRLLSEQNVGVLVLDLTMPHVSGEEILEHCVRHHPEVVVVVVTALEEVETAVRCIKAGAYDYFVKTSEMQDLVQAVRRAMEVRELRSENRRLQTLLQDDQLNRPECFTDIVTRSARMRAVLHYCEVVAPSREPVLILGETGVGKELAARAIHSVSSRRGAFTAVNAAGLDDQIFSDTLFGHRRGAFTGALSSRAGLIERAKGGSIFLDEVGDLQESSQVKLLRVLQEREYTPLGEDAPRSTDARVIAATHHDEQRLRGPGGLRSDLYYRLSVHVVRIPPLRERPEDIYPLVEHFLAAAAAEYNKKIPAYPPELMTLLGAYHFPGNVRELRGMVFDAVSRHEGRMLSLACFREHIGREGAHGAETAANLGGDPALWLRETPVLPSLKGVQAQLIEEALRRAEGNQRIAASMLGVSQQALSKRLKRSRGDAADEG
jgi:DNA-binding NtrC family response regulator